MLALTDEGLAMIAIAASAIAPQKRGQWLKRVAQELDPPIPMIGTDATNGRRSPAAARQARVRQRRRDGVRVYKLEISDRAVEGLITQLVTTRSLTEREALDHQRVEAELARLLEQQGERWSR
jgi:hypothetical protein